MTKDVEARLEKIERALVMLINLAQWGPASTWPDGVTDNFTAPDWKEITDIRMKMENRHLNK